MWRYSSLIFIIFSVKECYLQLFQFVETPSDALVAPGSNFTLTCLVSSSATITWYKGGAIITLGGRLAARNRGMELTVTGVQQSDGGTYLCEASTSLNDTLFSARSVGATIQVASIGRQPTTPSVPPLVRVVLGDFFILNCSLPMSVPAATVQWLRGSANVSVDDRFTVSSTESVSSLIASYFIDTDSNSYHCKVSNDLVPGGVPYTQESAQVTQAAGEPIASLLHRFVVEPEDVEVVAGKSVRLQCFVVGQPIPMISWQKDNVRLTAVTSNVTFEQSGRVLLIHKVQLAHAGVYKCTSSQDRGNMMYNNISTTAMLSVIVPPKVTMGVQYEEALVGSDIQLRCMAEGTPSITWEWRHNTDVILSDSHYTVSGDLLSISDAQLRHSGMYQCVARHDRGGQDASSNGVIIRTLAPSFLPNGIPNDLLAITGGSVVLVCNATGAPSPQYVWLKGNIVFDTSTSRFMLLENSGSVRITSLQRSDEGVYRCNASNSAASIVSRSSVLTVLDQPDVLYRPANGTAVQNSTVTIPCGIHVANAGVEYFWQLNNSRLNLLSTRYQLEEGNITISDVQAEDGGIYKCLANLSVSDNMANDLQFIVGSGMISIVFIPGSAGMPVASEIQSTDALLRWTVPLSDGGSPITHYIVEQRVIALFGTSLAQNFRSWIVSIANISGGDGDVQMGHVTSLHPYTGYQFRVVAVNEAGRGTPSLPSTIVTTLEAAPTAAPITLSVETTRELTELLVSWMAPPVRLVDGTGRNGIVINYSVIYYLEGILEPSGNITTANNDTILVLQRLQHSSEYIVMVAAITSQGMGPYTVPSSGQTLNPVPRPPDPPVIVDSFVVNFTTVMLLWKKPPLTTIANITGYLIQYHHPARKNDSNIMLVLPGDHMNITIIGLDGGQLYMFNVSAVNGNGSGLPLVFTLSTPIGSPTHILALSGRRLSTNAVSLSWVVPPDGGSELYGFKIEGFNIFERRWIQLAILPANVTTYTLGASDGRIYDGFRVSAFNQFGPSGTSNFQVGVPIVPREDAPNTLWFLVIFILFGLILVAFGFLITVVMCRRCRNAYSSGGYSFRDTDDSDLVSSVPSTTTFTNYEPRSRNRGSAPLFSSDTAPFATDQSARPPSPRAHSPMFSESSKSHLMPHGYPPPAGNPDGSTLTSGYSIDRPMFSDSTSDESPAPMGGGYQRGFTAQGQKISLKEYSQKTRSLESNVSTYV